MKLITLINFLFLVAYSYAQPLRIQNLTYPSNCQDNYSNGSAEIIVNDGTPPYSYLWSNGATTAKIVNLAPGSYNCTITDSSGEQVSTTANIGKLNDLNYYSTNITQASDCKSNDGSINLVLSINNYPPYTYLWDDDNHNTTSKLVDLKPGIYSVTVTDSKKCTLKSFFFLASKSQEISAEIYKNLPCSSIMGTLEAKVLKGGVAPYTYIWDNGTNNSIKKVGGNGGPHTVALIDKNGCLCTKTTYVSNYKDLRVDIIKNVDDKGEFLYEYKLCPTADVSISNGVFPYQFQWSNGTTMEKLNLSSLTFPQTYYCTVTDSKGCTGSFHTDISEYDYHPRRFYKKVICKNSITYQSVCNDYKHSFLWSNGATTSNLTNLNNGEYYVTITDETRKIINQDTIYIPSTINCAVTTSENTYYPKLNIEVYPNPSKDVINFYFENIDSQVIQLSIFNLHGQLIYEENTKGSNIVINNSDWQDNFYIYQIKDEQNRTAQGKICIVR